VHPNHLSAFTDAARTYKCNILVRKTGRAALTWVGRRGYTGKRADMKAKTANQSAGRYQIAGLVCSPWLQPGAFTADRIGSAQVEWSKCAHQMTVPENGRGFDDDRAPLGCRTPYIVQTNRNHPHYGCAALVDMGLLVPRYVHGDYDLYAIIPAGQSFDPHKVKPRMGSLGSTMAPDSLGLQERLRLSVPNLEGPLSFRIATDINNKICRSSPDLLGALMVNHGEQVNIGKKGVTNETVLAILPKPVDGQLTKILLDRREHEAFYKSV
jgi:hypothetical protein